MGALHARRHRRRVTRHQRVQQRFGVADGASHLAPARSRAHRAGKLPHDLAVRDESHPSLNVEREIAQVHEQRQHVIRIVERRHVIGVGARVNLHCLAGHEPDDPLVQAVHVHANVAAQRVKRLGLSPAALEVPRLHRPDDRTGAVRLHFSPMRPVQAVAVVPGTALCEASPHSRQSDSTSSSVKPM